MRAERLPNLPFNSIALNGQLDVLLADHQTQPGKVRRIAFGKQQTSLAVKLLFRRVKNGLELTGKQKAFLPAEVQTRHLMARSDRQALTALGTTA